MTQSMKRIHSVTIKRMYDESPDTSWLGEYSNKKTSEYSIDRAHSLDCPINTGIKTGACPSCGVAFSDVPYTANVECTACHDAVLEPETECNCGEHGDMGRHEYRYFNRSVNYKGESLEDTRKYVLQDYKRMESLNRGDWCFVGVRADAQVSFGKVNGDSYLLQDVTSGGLWGIESDSGDYFKELESEQLSELRGQLHAIGFSQRAISAAFKNVERRED